MQGRDQWALDESAEHQGMDVQVGMNNIELARGRPLHAGGDVHLFEDAPVGRTFEQPAFLNRIGAVGSSPAPARSPSHAVS